jgi:hypothetical protein
MLLSLEALAAQNVVEAENEMVLKIRELKNAMTAKR